MKKKFVVMMLCFLCLGCGKKEELGDSIRFKEEYEQYNEEYISLKISESNLIKYSTVEEVNQIIKEGTGVIYIGSPQDDLSRRVVDILFSVASNTGLEQIYYFDSLDEINGLEDIQDLNIPLVLFVAEGDILSYHIGTIDGKVDLSEDEVVQLYNIYLDGIHQVLGDACDERC